MEFVITEFNSKIDEINKYFSFLEDIITKDAQLHFKNKKNREISSDLQKILKANLFLLLYNLIESSYKKALKRICDKISSENLKYQDVILEIKKLWLEQKYRGFADNCSLPFKVKRLDFIISKIEDISEDIIELEFSDKNRFSGNLDVDEIKIYNDKYGLSTEELSNKEANSLYLIRHKRNSLAHGDESFGECGQNYSISELEKIKEESIKYMTFILNHIEKFLTDQKYKI